GIGQAIAEQLAKDGFDIAVHYNSDKASAESIAEDLKKHQVKTSVLGFNVSDREQTRAAIEKDIADNGAYYGIVCNAGITRDNAFPALSDDDWDSVIHTNLDGFYNVVHPAIMPMIRNRNGGRIVTMASVSGVIGNRGQVNYSASKAGLIGATKALAVELAKRKITVNCVAPGLIETKMADELVMDEILKAIPMRRVGNPEEVSGLVGFLMSDSASYITRQVISVNGGLA
ncbi:MAG: 3-oxoacyl-ACP reductase FabG, partial [Gammaproteobacteria bacterium]|nr:3-oxoacyl-ACP reductase FabG [Gammaproteobacteria bacterium]